MAERVKRGKAYVGAMNAFFSALAKRWTDGAASRGARIAPPELEPVIADQLLELARVVAHTKERSFAPLASYTAGVASERLRAAKGADATQIADYIREIREALEREVNA